MQSMRAQNVLVGGLMLVAGLGYLYMTATLPRRDTGGGAAIVDATFFPYILAILMVVLGILQLIAGFRTPDHATAPALDPDAEPEGGPINYVTVALTLVLIMAFTAALGPLGFPIAAAIYLFLQFIVLRPVNRNFGYPVYITIAVVASIVIFVTFRYGFQLLLPAGPLTAFLP
jgi:putative tricarboxylic transport membrane protein